MSTRYILAGGDDAHRPDYWDKLRMTIKHDEPLRILSCQFSQAEDKWEERFESFTPFFKQAFGEDMHSSLAAPENLEEQIKRNDVIYLHGGSTMGLREVMDQYSGIESSWKDKIVIGSSAGAHYLTKYHWSPGSRKVSKGAGILPYNIIVHYDSSYGSDEPEGPIDWEKAEAELREVVGDEKIIKIPEGDFVEFTV